MLFFNLWFTQAVSWSFCRPTHPITTRLNKPFHPSSLFCGVIGKILALVLWFMYARTSMRTRQLATFEPLGTWCKDSSERHSKWNGLLSFFIFVYVFFLFLFSLLLSSRFFFLSHCTLSFKPVSLSFPPSCACSVSFFFTLVYTCYPQPGNQR